MSSCSFAIFYDVEMLPNQVGKYCYKQTSPTECIETIMERRTDQERHAVPKVVEEKLKNGCSGKLSNRRAKTDGLARTD